MNAGQPTQQYGRKMQNVDVSVHEGRDKITAMFEVCCLSVSSVAAGETRVNGRSLLVALMSAHRVRAIAISVQAFTDMGGFEF